MADPCKYESAIATIGTDLKNLKESFKEFKDNDFHEIKENLTCIIRKMNKQRLPLWATWILTGSSALITGLVIVMLKK